MLENEKIPITKILAKKCNGKIATFSIIRTVRIEKVARLPHKSKGIREIPTIAALTME